MTGSPGAPSFIDADRIEVRPVWSIEYRECLRCGATTITFTHYMTGSRIECDPLPLPDGNVLPNFGTGQCRVISMKHLKDYPELWQVHAATCPALRKDAP